jgi:hypothetical protein
MSITHSQAEDLLINELLSNMPSIDGNQLSTSILQTPNAPFDAPKSGLWLRAGVSWDRATQLETGFTGKDVTEGVFFIDIFSPLNEGNKIYKELQTQIISLLNKKRLGGCIDIYAPFPNKIGVDNSWYHYQLQFTCRIVF